MNLDDYKEELKTRAEKYNLVFSTEKGREVLNDLKAGFLNRELKGEDSHDTYYRVGQRDLIQYIIDLVEMKA